MEYNFTLDFTAKIGGMKCWNSAHIPEIVFEYRKGDYSV